MKSYISRRQLLTAALGASGALSMLTAAHAGDNGSGATTAPAKVNEQDSLATALGYVSDAKRVDPKVNPTFQAGATCSGCSWYQGKPGDAAGGPCTFFPGKLVDSNGWCRMWSKKQ